MGFDCHLVSHQNMPWPILKHWFPVPVRIHSDLSHPESNPLSPQPALNGRSIFACVQLYLRWESEHDKATNGLIFEPLLLYYFYHKKYLPEENGADLWERDGGGEGGWGGGAEHR